MASMSGVAFPPAPSGSRSPDEGAREDELFKSLVISNPPPARSWLGMRVSLVLHTIGIGLLVLVPILWPSPAPEHPDYIRALIYNPLPPPPPPLPKGSALIPKPEPAKPRGKAGKVLRLVRNCALLGAGASSRASRATAGKPAVANRREDMTAPQRKTSFPNPLLVPLTKGD